MGSQQLRSFHCKPNGPKFVAQTQRVSQITGTLDSEPYKTARLSANSLRYDGLGLKNGKYNVEIHFAEMQMEDSQSWKGLGPGRRLFDIYAQVMPWILMLKISNRAVVKTFQANVTNTVMYIHLYWAGRGTCCIPFQSTYGPLYWFQPSTLLKHLIRSVLQEVTTKA